MGHCGKRFQRLNIIEKNLAFNSAIGIYLESSSENIIKNSTLKSIDTNIGLRKSSNNNIIEKNMASDSPKGIRVVNSNSSVIKNNVVTANDEGIGLSISNNSTIERNIILNNRLVAE